MSDIDAGATTTMRSAIVLAIAELDQVRSSDPAAARAIHAVRLTTMTLEDFWLPLLVGGDDPTPADDRPA